MQTWRYTWQDILLLLAKIDVDYNVPVETTTYALFHRCSIAIQRVYFFFSLISGTIRDDIVDKMMVRFAHNF